MVLDPQQQQQQRKGNVNIGFRSTTTPKAQCKHYFQIHRQTKTKKQSIVCNVRWESRIKLSYTLYFWESSQTHSSSIWRWSCFTMECTVLIEQKEDIFAKISEMYFRFLMSGWWKKVSFSLSRHRRRIRCATQFPP